MSLALVLNQNAGQSGDAAKLAAQLHATLPAGETLSARIATAVRAAPSAIVVAGGDGTIACACQHLAGTGIPLGIIPLGTMNLLAKDLRLPLDPTAAADAIVHATPRATPRAIDLGRLGPHVFACACMLGSPARIAHHRERARAHPSVGSRLAVLRAGLRALLRHRPTHLTLTVDNAPPVRVRTRALTITVNPLSEGQGRAFARATLDGGQLCAYIECARGLPDLLRLLANLALGAAKDSALLHLSGATLRVESRRPALRLLIDGEEHLLPTPLDFTIWPAALTVLAPPA